MELTSTRIVPAPVDTVWAALNDPVMLTSCIPGCEAILPDGENAYTISLAARVGPVSANFSGRLQISDLDPPRSYTLNFDGQGGAAGFAKGTAKVALAPAENGAATSLSYTVNAQVGGKIAQIGSRLVDGAAQKLADDFFGRFSDAVAAKVGAAPVAAAVRRMERAAAPGRRWIRIIALALIALLIAYLFARMRR
jgi:carbon monoxide dehydrogenase subunit G